MSEKEKREKEKGERETVTVIPETVILQENRLYSLDGRILRAVKPEQYHSCDQCALTGVTDGVCLRLDCTANDLILIDEVKA